MNAYSDFKLAWHLGALAALREGRLCHPCHLYLFPTSACNLRCVGCINGGSTRTLARPPHAALDRDFMITLLRDFAELGGRAVQFSGGGEPTRNPDFFAAVDEAAALSLSIGLVTNGVLGDERRARLLERLPFFTWIRVSVDAPDRETYRVRRGADAFTEVLDLLCVLHARRAKVSANYLVDSTTTADEIFQAAALAQNLDVPFRFAVRHVNYSPPRLAPEVLSTLASVAGPRVINSVPARLRQLEERNSHPAGECGMMYLAPVVASDGVLYACCLTAYDPRFALVDLRKTRLRDWWYSAARGQQASTWNAAVRCRGVACIHSGKNKLFRNLVRDVPDDVDFV